MGIQGEASKKGVFCCCYELRITLFNTKYVIMFIIVKKTPLNVLPIFSSEITLLDCFRGKKYSGNVRLHPPVHKIQNF